VATTRRACPTWASPGVKVAPVPTVVQIPGAVSACQVKVIGPTPSTSVNAWVAVRSWSSAGVVSLIVTVPTGGELAKARPSPVRATVEGEPAPLWAMLSEADLAPAVVGANRTPIEHEPARGTVAHVLLVMANCVGSVPTSVTPPTGMTSAEKPPLVTVTVWMVEVLPLVTDPKSIVAGATWATGAIVISGARTSQVPRSTPGTSQKLSCSTFQRVSVPSTATVAASLTVTLPSTLTVML